MGVVDGDLSYSSDYNGVINRMWALDNRTPYEAERTWVRDAEGKHHWIVVVKATYDIDQSGKLSLSEDPMPPLHAAEYVGADGQSSLRYEADLVAMKPGTDVYLNATAHSPLQKPVTRLEVGFRLASIQKRLIVHGDRIWERSMAGGASPSKPQPFTTMPITYERAFGGIDQQDVDSKKHGFEAHNPVGTGFATNPAHLMGKPVANLEIPGEKKEIGRPAGLGAIACFWSPRRELAGTYNERWAAQRQPMLPEDYNPTTLLCAPEDQQVAGYLKGGAVAELVNLNASGRLRFALPDVNYRFRTQFGSNEQEHTGELVSVVIEPDASRLILVWQTSLPVGNNGEYLDSTMIESEERPR